MPLDGVLVDEEEWEDGEVGVAGVGFGTVVTGFELEVVELDDDFGVDTFGTFADPSWATDDFVAFELEGDELLLDEGFDEELDFEELDHEELEDDFPPPPPLQWAKMIRMSKIQNLMDIFNI